MKTIRNIVCAGTLLLAFSAFAQDDLWDDAVVGKPKVVEQPKPAPKPAPQPKPAPAPVQQAKPAPAPQPAPAPAPVQQVEPAPAPQPAPAPAPVQQAEPAPAPQPAPAPAPVQQAEPAPAPQPAPAPAPQPVAKPVEQQPAPAAKEAAAAAAAPAKTSSESGAKRFWAGLIVSGTYNDFHSTKFGFDNIETGEGYHLKVKGTNDIMSNYWGVGANVGFSGFFLLNSYLGVRADLALASRRGDGESDVSVRLYWDDETRQPEKSDVKMKYYVRQMNIDVPLALRFMFPSKVYLEAGPMMSFNLYSKTKFSVTDIYGTEDFREHDCFDTFEFATVYGIGGMRPIGKTMLDIGLRFVYGITALSDADDSPKTWQWQFNVAYWFI